MIRWTLKLSEFNIEWEHHPGVQNVVADVLSGNPVGNMDGSQISCAALRVLAFNSPEELIREQRSSRSQPGKFKGSRKNSSEESNSRKSNKGNAGWEDPRLKRKVRSNGSRDRKDLTLRKKHRIPLQLPYKIAQGNLTASCKRLISWFLLDKRTELGHKIVPVRPPKF
ncbi:hypothetical protein TNCV_1562411 [Trichonephila clavipes]|nr:hypothetical protein TNCV_1562411 [Trichonephila clavipes]